MIKLQQAISNKTILASWGIVNTLTPRTKSYFFIGKNSHWAHPSALLSKRFDFIQRLSRSKNKELAVWLLSNNIFGKIDLIWPDDNGYIATEHDNFPNGRRELQFNLNPIIKALTPSKDYSNLYLVPSAQSRPNTNGLSDADKQLLKEYGHDKQQGGVNDE